MTIDLNAILHADMTEFLSATHHTLNTVRDAFIQQEIVCADDEITPVVLQDSFAQFGDILQGAEEGGAGQTLDTLDLTQLGDHAVQLLSALLSWSVRLKCPDEELMIARALIIWQVRWVANKGGDLPQVEAMVDNVGQFANQLKEPALLSALCPIVGDYIKAMPAVLQQDLEQFNPNRPWRVLHLNYAIIATRSFDPEQMNSAFQVLVEHLPMDAKAFFQEGMQRMAVMNYPDSAREVMERYNTAWNASDKIH